MSVAEFDDYARNYHKQMDHRLRRFVDPTENYFIELKTKFLNDFIKSPDSVTPDNKLKILELGCGLGDYVKYLHKGERDVIGLDLSFEMLKYAKINNSKINPGFLQADGKLMPFKDNSFDVVFSICVFHHIDFGNLDQVISEIKRVCKKGGKIFIFEHNPNNLITQFVVRTTPIDKNAKLIKSSTLYPILHRHNFSIEKKGFLLFGPRPIDKIINQTFPQFHKLPLGGQYYIYAINN